MQDLQQVIDSPISSVHASSPFSLFPTYQEQEDDGSEQFRGDFISFSFHYSDGGWGMYVREFWKVIRSVLSFH